MLTIYYSQITILFKKKRITWYWETKSKAIILAPCIHPSLYTNSQKYFNELLKIDRLNWKQIYLLPCLVTSWQLFWFLSILNFEQSFLFKWKAFNVLKIDFTSLSFLQTFRWDSTPSILRMRYSSKFMEWTRFIFWKRLHSFWPNTAGCLFRFS